MSNQTVRLAPSTPLLKGGLFALGVVIALVAFRPGLVELVNRWSRQEEYSHGFLIPIVAAWMLWSRRAVLRQSLGRPSWWGAVLIVLASAMLVVGDLSSLFLLSQVGFIIAVLGLVLTIGGFPLLRVTSLPIAFLLFAIPLPYFLDSELSWRLQLISSQLGVVLIRAFGVPVYLSGNVIDLGIYKLQVVEACSGLRYLYPLLSFGFLAAYLFQAPLWQRILVFLSAVPITIVMNSVRIAMVGLLVNHWGTAQAEGLLHFFEGWVIFMACAAILAGEVWLLARFFSGRTFFDVFYLPKLTAKAFPVARAGVPLALLVCVALLGLSGVASYHISQRTEIVPERSRFAFFPTKLGSWEGRASLLDPQIEHALHLEDYILSDYVRPGDGRVNFYVAYYASQRKGTSPHSPMVCIPGDGWHIANFQRTQVLNDATGVTQPINRAVIARDKQQQLVYYWFVQRGRNIANEYLSKWALLVDAITINRTDGALVRLITPINPGETEQAADQRLQSFLADLQPQLRAYLPAEPNKAIKSALQSSFPRP